MGVVGFALTRRNPDEISTLDSSPGPATSAPSSALAPRDSMPTAFGDGVEMVVYLAAGASPDSVDRVRGVLTAFPQLITSDGVRYLDRDESLVEARRLLAADPTALGSLTTETVPTVFYVDPIDPANPAELAGLADEIKVLPEVLRVDLEPGATPVIPTGTAAPPTTQPPPLLTDGPPLFGDPEIGASSPNFLAAGDAIREAKANTPGLSQMDPVLVGPVDVIEPGEIRIDVQLPSGSDFTDVGYMLPGDVDEHLYFSPTIEPIGPDDGLVQVVLHVAGVTSPYLDFRIWIQ